MPQNPKVSTQLTPDEVMIIQMALETTIEDMGAMASDPKANFTPDARKMMRDMMAAAHSAKAKIAAASGHEVRLDPFVDGDEKEFLTKES